MHDEFVEKQSLGIEYDKYAEGSPLFVADASKSYRNLEVQRDRLAR